MIIAVCKDSYVVYACGFDRNRKWEWFCESKLRCKNDAAKMTLQKLHKCHHVHSPNHIYYWERCRFNLPPKCMRYWQTANQSKHYIIKNSIHFGVLCATCYLLSEFVFVYFMYFRWTVTWENCKKNLPEAYCPDNLGFPNFFLVGLTNLPNLKLVFNHLNFSCHTFDIFMTNVT